MYPCYYFSPCNFTKLTKLVVEKCPIGLVFDQNSQKCDWTNVWHGKSCHTNRTINSTVLKAFLLSELENDNSSVIYSQKRSLLKPNEQFIDPILSNINHSQDARNKSQFANLIYMNNSPNPNSKIYYFNELSNQLNEDDTETDSYAYVIVPLKLENKKTKEKHLDTKKSNLNDYKETLRYKKVCYFTNWSQYRSSAGRFLPENVDPFLCSHLVFAFAYIDETTLTLTTVEKNDEEMYKRINNLKTINPKLKTLLGVGGWK